MKNSSKTSGLLDRTRAAAKLALALLLVMTMVVYVPPSPSSQAYAYDGPVGSIKYGGKKIEYDEYAELVHELENLANEEVTVEMYCDWSPDAVGMESGLHIPVGARVTLNMNGHLFDRGRTGKEAKDPCVQVHSGATLTVNGGDRSYEHDVLAYTSLSGDTKGAVRSGGVFTGGNVGRRDSEAGGIKVEKGTVTLNDVTIIGCSPRGIDAYKSTVSLNNSVIEANKEGGFYTWETTIKLSNSHIKDNYSADGGGVLVQNATTIEGDGSSSITGNVAANYGGGVYVEMLYFTLNYEGNGVMSDCTIQNNTAERYGGVYAHEYYNEDWALNGGTFSHSLSGALVVKDNTATDGSGYNNYCIEVNRDHWVNNRSSFKLGEGAEVWLSVVENPGLDFVNETIHDADCAQYLHSDQTGYIFEYDSESSLIQRTTGQEGDTTSKQTVTAANANDASGKDNSAQERTVAGKVGTVGAGGADGTEYDKVRGFFMRDNEDQFGVFYYSDGLFYGEPTAYNEHLATLTWALAYVGGYLNEDKEAVNGNKYYNKHAAARQFFADIGCPDQNIYVNDYNLVKPGTDSIGVAIASKELERIGEDGKKEKTGDILIPVTVRGMGYETEWLSNVTLGTATEMVDSGAEAKGFSEAATQVMNEIGYYLQKYNLEEAFAEGHVKFWVTGFSRAGATANLVSKRLVDKVAAECKGEDKSEVFAYPCEAPKGGTDKAEVPGNDYTCIHNMINAVDIVPFVAPELMGFKRYGVDHYIPGTDAGTVKTTQKAVQRGGDGGPDTVTTYADNEICYTKTAAYNSQRELMLRQLKALDPGMKFDDYFRPVAMNFIDFKIENPLKQWPPYSYDTMRQYYNGDENNQVEYFVADFIRLAQEGIDAGYGGRSEAVPSRDYYARDKIADDYELLQDSARDLMYVFMTSELGGFLDRAGNIKDDMSYVSLLPGQMSMLKMYGEIRGWYKRTEGQKRATVSDLWEALKDTGALDKLDATTRSKMESAFPAVGYVALTLANADYVHHPADNPEGYQWAKGSNETMMSLPTLMRYYKYIISCHMPQINMAWARTYDSWYAEEYNAYGLERPASVDAPRAYGTEAGKQKQVVASSAASGILVGDQRITLENPEIVGEAVTVEAPQGSTVEESYTRNDDGSVTFDVVFPSTGNSGASRPTDVMRLDVAGVNLNGNKDIVFDSALGYDVHPGDAVTVAAPDVKGMQFDSWSLEGTGISLANEEGNALTEKTVILQVPSSLPDKGVSITARYKPLVSQIDVSLYKASSLFSPEGGKRKQDRAVVSVTIGNDVYEIIPACVNVTWSPELDRETFLHQIEYTATAQLVAYPDRGYYARKQGTTSYDISFSPENIAVADDVVVTFNKGSADTSYDPEENASYNPEKRSASKAFPKTIYVLSKVKQPGNIDGVPYEFGDTADKVKAILPNSTNVLTTDGHEYTVDITWGTPVVTSGGEDEYAAKVWTAKSTLTLPDSVANKNNVSLEVTTTVSVEAAPIALSPSMSLAEGTYEYDQWSTLITNEEGGTTYFTTSQKGAVDPEEPTDPDAARAVLADDNDTFSISRLRALPTTTEDIDENDNLIEVPVKSVIVKAYTEAPGKRPSSVVAFEYQFRDVPVPEGQNSDYDGEEHIGVQASPYYTLSVGPDSNARVDEYGNVVATVPGTYTVTAELALGNDYWEADDQGARNREDKTLQFTIKGEDLPEASVHKFGIDASPTEGGTVAGAGTYVDGMYVSAKAWANEGYEFVNWTLVSDSPNLDGKVVSDDFAYAFPLKDDLKLQANFARVLTVRWLDADGNEVDSKTYLDGESEPTTDVKPTKQADAQYTYTFAGWNLVASDDDTVKTYEPRFTQTVNMYTVRFVNHDGTVLQEGKLAYGETPAYKGAEPTKSAAAEYTYAFAGWTPKIAAVTGDAVYEATFTAKSKPSDPEEKSEPSDPGVSTVKMLRLYNHWSGEHFYTADGEEHANLVVLGWTDEGVGWMAPMTSDAPVYRLYNSYAGEHHYTLDESEKDALVALGWTDEGIGWYSDDAKTVPLYREYNPNEFANNHNYTADKVERDGLVSIGWIDEGIAWYGASSSQEE